MTTTRLQIARRYFAAIFAKFRNQEKLKKQTHLHQKRRGIRPPNTVARRTMIFKRIHNIEP